jgi:hypothetical protein
MNEQFMLCGLAARFNRSANGRKTARHTRRLAGRIAAAGGEARGSAH